MKKKIKQLTQKEIDDICDNHPLCVKCPFASSDTGICGCYALDRDLWGDLEVECE